MQDHSSQLVDHQKQHQQLEQFNSEDNNHFINHNEPQNQIYQNDNEVPPNYQSNHHWSQSIFHYESIAIGLYTV